MALTNQSGPSVVQIRTQNVLPDVVGDLVISALLEHQNILESGALMTINVKGARIRILPLNR